MPILEILDQHNVRVDISSLGVPLTGGPTTYDVLGPIEPGDYLVVKSFSEDPEDIDRSVFPIYEGEILQVLSATAGELVVGRILSDGSVSQLNFTVDSIFTMEVVFFRATFPYSLNPVIPYTRTNRIHKRYNLMADDLRMVEDALTLEVFIP